MPRVLGRLVPHIDVEGEALSDGAVAATAAGDGPA